VTGGGARDRALALLLLAPALVFVLGIVVYPLAMAGWYSVSDAQVGETGRFVGVDNYGYLLAQGTFHDAARNTVVYTLAGTLLKAGVGLAMALALSGPFPGRRLVTAALFLPFVFPTVVATIAWYYLFSNVHGGLNYALLGLHLVRQSVPFLGAAWSAMAALVTVNVWHGAALFAVLVLAALRTVPRDVLDAATTDGAGALRRFRHVVLPALVPAFALGAALSVAGTFGDFAIVHLLTGGGPANGTTILSTMAFQTALRDGDLGVASAVALSIMPLYAAGLVFLLRLVRR
jgi:multiple sugar transport system permease protein